MTFSELAGEACPAHEALSLGLAAELGARVPVARAQAELAGLAAVLPPERNPTAQLRAITELADARLRVREDGALLLPDALAAGAGHPVAVTIALACAAARAGYGVDIVGCDDDLYLAHPEVPLLVDVRQPSGSPPIAGLSLGRDLYWRCAHEVVGVTLVLLTREAERRGDLSTALAASALMFALPVDDHTLEDHRADHDRLLSRLN